MYRMLPIKPDEDRPERVNINTCSTEELESLPGISTITAEKIISHRQTIGKFSSPEEVQTVPGIGPKRYEKIRDLIDSNNKGDSNVGE